ncbi:pentapeptide repeat-containing protein [uncultured Roseibium sp.]|uniref:pentapeptide repeat-containing protein n=1 Tax=uncultured Roseibium sp. TaxID=1936171 RepID=UPI0026265544|nr:pentapeptide repeat-containing protein [uncultured Roseibium sp.]
MRTLTISISIVFVLISLFVAAAIAKVEISPESIGSEQKYTVVCQGKYNNVRINETELRNIIESHENWLSRIEESGYRFDNQKTEPYSEVIAFGIGEPFAASGFSSGLPYPINTSKKILVSNDGRADLCGARITGLSFRNADMRYARLMGARFEDTDFSNANFRWAFLDAAGFLNSGVNPDLRAPDFSGASLHSAIFSGSDFSGSDFDSTSFIYSDISNSSFKGASFWSADFRKAQLREVDFTGAYVSRVQFDHALLNFKGGKTPDPQSFRDTAGLTSLLVFGGAEASLKELRDELNAKKLLLPAAEINFALNNEENTEESKNRYFPLYHKANWLLNGVTYAYGLRPQRLVISATLIAAFFSYLYYVAIVFSGSSRRDGIWITFPIAPDAPSSKQPKTFRLSKANCSPFRAAIWFSILSAFRIGWGNLSVGDWISRVQPHGFTYQATGWPRAIAGIQSLITVYFLILLVSKYVF